MASRDSVTLESFSEYKRFLTDSIGREQLAALHQESKPKDVLIVVSWALFVFINSVLIYQSNELYWLAPLIFLQGLLFTQLGLINHEFIVHRRVFGSKCSWFVSMALSLPTLIKSTNYSYVHMIHHRFFGTEKDGEDYKQDLDSVWKRIVFSTFVGVLLAPRRFFGPKGKTEYFDISSASSAVKNRAKIEGLGRITTFFPL